MTITVDIPRDKRAPASARRAVDDLSGTVDATVIPDVKLLVSELITNSVKYGGEGDVQLVMKVRDGHTMRVEVVDRGQGFIPIPRDRPATEAGGWGLHLVQTLSDSWGVREDPANVWFEIQR